MRILVTGGSGFVGKRLVEILISAGHSVTNLDALPSQRFSKNTLVGDIRSQETCNSACDGVDAIVHLAALYRDDVRPRELYYEVNVEGTRNIARAAALHGVPHIVFTSSFSVYGLDDAGKNEDGTLAPVNDYGRSKLAAEGILRDWHSAQPGRTLHVVRPCVIFGEGGRGNVWTLVRQIASGRFAMVGQGRNRKSMAYVGNIVEFLKQVIDQRDGHVHVVNYADKPDLTVQEIVSLTAQTLGVRVLNAPLPNWVAMAIGYLGDAYGGIIGRVPTLSSERIRKFLADTSLPIEQLERTGFSRPFDLREAFVRTVRHEFPSKARSRAPHGEVGL